MFFARSCADRARSSGRPSRCRDPWRGSSLTTRPPMAISPPVISSSPAIIRSKRGLAAARRADQHHEFAVVDIDADAVHDLDGAERLANIPEFHGGHMVQTPFAWRGSSAAAASNYAAKPFVSVMARSGRHAQPFTAPAVSPPMNSRCMARNRIAIGSVMISDAAITAPQSVLNSVGELGDADRQGLHARVLRQHEREDELVPGRHEGVDDDGDDARQRQRQRDAEEDAEPRRAVDDGRFLEFDRDCPEVAGQHPYAERQRDDRVDEDQARDRCSPDRARAA